jgi:hypothetical protein
MKPEEMRAKIQELVDRFAPWEEPCKQKKVLVIEAVKNAELVSIFNELHSLMQHSVFFEVILQTGFQKICSKNVTRRDQSLKEIESWNLASPILPLLEAMHDVLIKSQRESKGVKFKVSPFSSLEVGKQYWDGGAVFGFDSIISQQLMTSVKNELFLGFFALDLTESSDQETYRKIITQLNQSPQNATALLSVCDGVFSESICFIKDENGLTALLATKDHSEKVSYIHRFTRELATENKITLLPCKNMKIIHNGDCSIYSEININGILYEALKRQSIYKTLMALKENKLNLSDARIQMADLGIQSSTRGDPPLLRRWLCGNAGLFFLRAHAQGWLDFCEKIGIHPVYMIKTKDQNWSIELYKSNIYLNYPLFFPLPIPILDSVIGDTLKDFPTSSPGQFQLPNDENGESRIVKIPTEESINTPPVAFDDEEESKQYLINCINLAILGKSKVNNPSTDIPKLGADSYLGWMSANASGTRGWNRFSHWYHGDSGIKRARELLEVTNNRNSTYKQILEQLQKANGESSNNKHSLSRYLLSQLHRFSFTEVEKINEDDFKEIKLSLI